MGDDLRLDADYFGNVKILRLLRRLGDAGARAHIQLLCYVRKFRPSGELDGLDAEGIALAAGWSGDPDQFHQTLSELILIERSDAGQWRIHDWLTVNEWAAGTAGRSAHAKKLNHQRWYVARKIACPNTQCVECEPFRPSKSELISEPILTASAAESVPDSSSRLVSSRSVSKEKPFEENSEPCRLASLLHDLIRERDPKHKGNAQKDAIHVDRLLRIDQRTPEEIESVIRWVHADSFEQHNVLSAAKLRARFTALLGKSKAQTVAPFQKHQKGGRNAAIDSFFENRG